MIRRFSWPLILCAAGVILLNPACQIEETREGAGSALDFSYRLLDGSTIDAADYYGSVVLINFWDSWCGSCQAEQDDLNRLYTDLHSSGLEILGLALARDGVPAIEQYLAAEHVPYAVGLFGEEVEAMFGYPEALPQTYIIDRNGKIAHEISGSTGYDEFVSLIEPLLSN